MKVLLARLWRLRWSIVAFLGTLGAAFVTLGYSSLLLYGASMPVLSLIYPPMSEWKGPWVWPVLVGVTIVFAPSFLVAGAIDQILDDRRLGRRTRLVGYLAILWIGAIAAWLVVLAGNYPPGGRG